MRDESIVEPVRNEVVIAKGLLTNHPAYAGATGCGMYTPEEYEEAKLVQARKGSGWSIEMYQRGTWWYLVVEKRSW